MSINDFWIVLTGMLATVSCALLGSFLVLRRMSLLGDALSHAVLPGIAIAFLFTGSRGVLTMFLGAAAFGLLTVMLIESLHRRWRVQEDAAIGIVFTALFAFGVVLISLFAGQVDLDQECVLYGEIAYTPWDTLVWGAVELGPRPVWILASVLLVDVLLIVLLYKELVISSFDPAMAVAVGINATLIHYLLMGAVSITTVAAFESVGAILVVAMLIVPGATAYLWTDRLPVILVLSAAFGAFSAIAGYALASRWDSSIAGAMVVVSGLVFALSVLVSPQHGIVARLLRRLLLALQVTQDHIMLALVRRTEAGDDSTPVASVMDAISAWRGLAWGALLQLRRRGLVTAAVQGLVLTPAGRAAAQELLQGHRMWERYMLQETGLPPDHVHESANRAEHFIDEQLRTELEDR